MGFTRPGRCHQAVLSSGGKGEVLYQPSPPASHLRISRGFPVPVRALSLPHSPPIPVREGAPKHSELWAIPPCREWVLTSQRATTALTLGVTPWPRLRWDLGDFSFAPTPALQIQCSGVPALCHGGGCSLL